jgi:hypothetical protein
MQRLLPSELARHLNVSPSVLRRTTRRGEPCGGHPVGEWALRRGLQVLYEVPEEAAEALGEPDAKYLKRQSRVLMTFMRGSPMRSSSGDSNPDWDSEKDPKSPGR